MGKTDYEDIFRFRVRTEPNEAELQEIEDIKQKLSKNKFTFLKDGKTRKLSKTENEKLNQTDFGLEEIIPSDWKNDYKKFKQRKIGNERKVEMKSPPMLRRVGEHPKDITDGNTD